MRWDTTRLRAISRTTMWMLIAREPVPDAHCWPGRRWLAAGDAVAWPLAWVAFIQAMPRPMGIVASLAVAIAVFASLTRLHRALYFNHRYQFTTLRWGRFSVGVLFAGLILKLMA